MVVKPMIDIFFLLSGKILNVPDYIVSGGEGEGERETRSTRYLHILLVHSRVISNVIMITSSRRYLLYMLIISSLVSIHKLSST